MEGNVTTGLNGKQVFVVPITAGYTAQTDIEDFLNSGVHGEIGVFNPDDNTVITGALTAGQKYYIAQKVVSDGVNTITKSAVLKHIQNVGGTPVSAYGRACNLVVGVKEVRTITLNTPATLKGQTFGINLFDKGFASEKFPQEFYSFISKTGAETTTQIATGIVADFNKQQLNYLTKGIGYLPTRYNITSAGNVITITALKDTTHTEITYTEDMALTADPVIATTTAWRPAEGSSKEVYQLEWEGKHRDGYTIPFEKHILDNYGGDYYFTVNGCTYDSIYLNTIQDRGVLDVMDAKLNYGVVFAIQSTVVGTSGSASYTTLKTILEL